MTIFSRYTAIFPSKWSSLFKRKEIYILIIIIHVVINSSIVIGILPLVNTAVGVIFNDSIKENPDLQYFLNESTFFFINYEFYAYGSLLSILGIVFLYSLFGIVIVVFIHQIQHNKNSYYVNDKVQKSLLISSISQVSLTLGF